MAITAVMLPDNSAVERLNSQQTGQSLNKNSGKAFAASRQQPTVAQTMITSERLESDSMILKYQNKDGDTVSLNIQSVDCQKSILTINPDTMTDEDWKKLIKQIKDEVLAMKKEMVDTLTDSVDGKIDNTEKKAGTADATGAERPVADVPEYWNAENTSQRIVDFALSFRGLFKGTDEEYYNLIKGAIDDGFKQARDMLGDLPDAVNNLVDDTHTLTMKKLDDWLSGRKTSQDAAQQAA
jgi:hypothetical protein